MHRSRPRCVTSREKSFTSITSRFPNPMVSSLNLVTQSTYNNNNNNNNNNNSNNNTKEIHRMWNVKCTILPIIIGDTGIVTRNSRKNMEAVPEKHSIDSLQKTAMLATSHITRRVLQCEAWSLSGGDHRWFERSTRKKRPVTRNIHFV